MFRHRAFSRITAVSVHRQIPNRPLPPPATHQIETYGMKVCIVLAHLLPGYRALLSEEWNTVLDHSLPTIVARNFNSKHPSWNSQKSRKSTMAKSSYSLSAWLGRLKPLLLCGVRPLSATAGSNSHAPGGCTIVTLWRLKRTIW